MIEVIDRHARARARARWLRGVAAARAHHLRRGDAPLRLATGPIAASGWRSHDLTDVFRASEFKVFAGAIEAGGVVRAIKAGGEWPRSRFDATDREGAGARGQGARLGRRRGGLAGARRSRSSCRRTRSRGATEALGATEGEAILIVADKPDVAAKRAGRAAPRGRGPRAGGSRRLLGRRLSRCSSGTRGRGAGTRCITHSRARPRTATSTPTPARWRSRGYDVIVDGWEIGGGSIRNSDPAVQQKVFDALGHRSRGGAGALRLPARGASATAPRRTAAWRSASTASWPCWPGAPSIRDVIAFPKAASGIDPLTGAPAPVDQRAARRARRAGGHATRAALVSISARACTPVGRTC